MFCSYLLVSYLMLLCISCSRAISSFCAPGVDHVMARQRWWNLQSELRFQIWVGLYLLQEGGLWNSCHSLQAQLSPLGLMFLMTQIYDMEWNEMCVSWFLALMSGTRQTSRVVSYNSMYFVRGAARCAHISCHFEHVSMLILADDYCQR